MQILSPDTFIAYNAFIKEINFYEMKDVEIEEEEEEKEFDLIDQFEALEVVSMAESDYSIVPSSKPSPALVPKETTPTWFDIFKNPFPLAPGSIFLDYSVLKADTIYDSDPVKNKTWFSNLPQKMPKGNLPVTFHK